MKAPLLSLVLAASVFAQSPLINTPANVVACQPILLTWSGGTPPYFLSVLPGADPNGQALVDFGQQNGTSLSWLVNVQPNTQIGLTLRDSTGLTSQSAPFTVNPGSSTSCLGQPVSTSAGAGGPAPAPTTGGTPPASTPPAGTTPPTSPTSPAATAPTSAPSAGTSRPASTTASRSSAAGSSASTSSTAAASTNLAQIGLAGFFGAALAAALV